MKKILPLLFCLLSITQLRAQFNVYHPFPDSNVYWKEVSTSSAVTGGSCETYGYCFIGDTLVNGHLHHKLYQVGGIYSSSIICYGTPANVISYYGAIWQDTMKHVYLFTGQAGSKDTLLYDFNLQVGDTLKQYNCSPTYYVPCYVSNIDSINIDGIYRKQFIITAVPSIYTGGQAQIVDSIIEGIGSLQGLIEYIGPIFEVATNLTCFWQNGHAYQFYANPGPFGDSCQVFGPLATKYINNITCSFKLAPNPTSNQVKLSYQLPANQNVGELLLYNTFGQLIRSEKISSANSTITQDVSILSAGVYYYTLVVNGSVMATNKLVVIK